MKLIIILNAVLAHVEFIGATTTRARAATTTTPTIRTGHYT
ncbi:MAG: hypothetical protein ACJ71I_17635 [Nitrososphaeraceae archaeon]